MCSWTSCQCDKPWETQSFLHPQRALQVPQPRRHCSLVSHTAAWTSLPHGHSSVLDQVISHHRAGGAHRIFSRRHSLQVVAYWSKERSATLPLPGKFFLSFPNLDAGRFPNLSKLFYIAVNAVVFLLRQSHFLQVEEEHWMLSTGSFLCTANSWKFTRPQLVEWLHPGGQGSRNWCTIQFSLCLTKWLLKERKSQQRTHAFSFLPDPRTRNSGFCTPVFPETAWKIKASNWERQSKPSNTWPHICISCKASVST